MALITQMREFLFFNTNMKFCQVISLRGKFWFLVLEVSSSENVKIEGGYCTVYNTVSLGDWLGWYK